MRVASVLCSDGFQVRLCVPKASLAPMKKFKYCTSVASYNTASSHYFAPVHSQVRPKDAPRKKLSNPQSTWLIILMGIYRKTVTRSKNSRLEPGLCAETPTCSMRTITPTLWGCTSGEKYNFNFSDSLYFCTTFFTRILFACSCWTLTDCQLV